MMGFRQVFEVSWLWVQFQCIKLPNSISVDDFASLDTPEGPGGVKVVDIFVFEKYFSCFLDVGAIWRKKLFSSN